MDIDRLSRLEREAVDFVGDNVSALDVYDEETLVDLVRDLVHKYFDPEDVFEEKELLAWYDRITE